MEVSAMAIKRVWIEEGCILCGNSQAGCPEVFVIHDDASSAAVRNGVDFSRYEKQIRDAAEFCPVDVIKYEEG
jgi:ferredoxin